MLPKIPNWIKLGDSKPTQEEAKSRLRQTLADLKQVQKPDEKLVKSLQNAIIASVKKIEEISDRQISWADGEGKQLKYLDQLRGKNSLAFQIAMTRFDSGDLIKIRRQIPNYRYRDVSEVIEKAFEYLLDRLPSNPDILLRIGEEVVDKTYVDTWFRKPFTQSIYDDSQRLCKATICDENFNQREEYYTERQSFPEKAFELRKMTQEDYLNLPSKIGDGWYSMESIDEGVDVLLPNFERAKVLKYETEDPDEMQMSLKYYVLVFDSKKKVLQAELDSLPRITQDQARRIELYRKQMIPKSREDLMKFQLSNSTVNLTGGESGTPASFKQLRYISHLFGIKPEGQPDVIILSDSNYYDQELKRLSRAWEQVRSDENVDFERAEYRVLSQSNRLMLRPREKARLDYLRKKFEGK